MHSILQSDICFVHTWHFLTNIPQRRWHLPELRGVFSFAGHQGGDQSWDPQR